MRKLTFKLPDGREFTIEVPKENDEFWWTEGNMSCDCNRKIEIERQHPDVVFEDPLMCGDTIELIKVDPDWEPDNELWGV